MASVPTLSIIESGPDGTQRLPFNIEAEKALLGALLVENRLLEEITLQLRDEHFYEPLHGRIFAQIRRLADLNMVANPITLRPLFETDPALAELGGAAYLLRLTEDPTVVIAARDCAQQTYDLALLRALVLVGTDLVHSATDTSAEVAPMKQIEAAEEAPENLAYTRYVLETGYSGDFLDLLAALALVAWVAAGPWLAIRGIERAIAQRDTAALERHVDFPRLRVNLKAQLDDRMVRAAGQDIASNPLGAIALAMAGGATGVAVDTLATPLGIGALLQGHVLWQRAGGRTVGGDKVE